MAVAGTLTQLITGDNPLFSDDGGGDATANRKKVERKARENLAALPQKLAELANALAVLNIRISTSLSTPRRFLTIRTAWRNEAAASSPLSSSSI